LSFDMIIVLSILLLAIGLFVSNRLRVDLVGLLVLLACVLTGLVTPQEALSGFSDPAVVTVGAVFVLSGGLSKTGVANWIGRQILRIAGKGEIQLIILIMVTAGILSGFMNNVGVAALFLPMVMEMARRTGHSPSKLFMPLSFGCLVGGLVTLIGTPPNIIVSQVLIARGYPGFQLFDFTPLGSVIMLTGVAFMALIGRHLLPNRDISAQPALSEPGDVVRFYELHHRLFVVHVPEESPLSGKTLAQSRMRPVLGLNVVAVMRGVETHLAPGPDMVLKDGDRLLVEGDPNRLEDLHGRLRFTIEDTELPVERLTSSAVHLVKAEVSKDSPLVGRTLREVDFRVRYRASVLAIKRNGNLRRALLQDVPLESGDILLMQAPRSSTDAVKESPDFHLLETETADLFSLHERLVGVRVPKDSTLVSKTIEETGFGRVFDLTVVGIVRDEQLLLAPRQSEQVQAGDLLLVEGKKEHLNTLHGLEKLHIESQQIADIGELESGEASLVEAILSPHTTLAGKTLRQLQFREKYGLNVLSIWREGSPHGDTEIADMPLRFGDALLLYGSLAKLRVLGKEPDFVLLNRDVQETPRWEKAPLAVLLMALILIPVTLGWLPIAIAALAGATLMVVTRCLSVQEAYRHVEWRAVFLIAGMIPLAIAMQKTGTAEFLATSVVSIVGQYGPVATVAGLYLVTAVAAQMIPTAAVAMLMAPIALDTAVDLGLSTESLVMAVAMASSASFMSPVGHPANTLVMGPGGYRFTDYLKVGLPLTLAVFVVVMMVLPIFWPIVPK